MFSAHKSNKISRLLKITNQNVFCNLLAVHHTVTSCNIIYFFVLIFTHFLNR